MTAEATWVNMKLGPLQKLCPEDFAVLPTLEMAKQA